MSAPLQNTGKIDAQIRSQAQAMVDAGVTGTQVAKDVAARTGFYTLASLLIGPEALAEYAFQKGFRGVVRGGTGVVRAGDAFLSQEGGIASRSLKAGTGIAERIGAEFLSETVGHTAYGNYILAKNYLDSDSPLLRQAFADPSFYVSHRDNAEALRLQEVRDNHQRGVSVIDLSFTNKL